MEVFRNFCYIGKMSSAPLRDLPKNLLAEFEQKFFWWEPIASQPRTDARILAQAMELASFDDVQRLEAEIGADHLVDAMLTAQPGWLSARSWEFWRGRLERATGRTIPQKPPQRSFGAGIL